MTSRNITTLAALATVLIAAAGSLVRGARESERDAAAPAAPPATVAAATARSETWQRHLETVGTLAAYRGVEVTAEVPGLVSQINFESGDEAQEGELLVELSTDTDRARLRTIEAELEQARADLARSTALDERGLIATVELDQRKTAVDRLAAQADEQLAGGGHQ